VQRLRVGALATGSFMMPHHRLRVHQVHVMTVLVLAAAFALRVTGAVPREELPGFVKALRALLLVTFVREFSSLISLIARTVREVRTLATRY